MTIAAAEANTAARHPVDRLAAALGDIPHTLDAGVVRRRSRDYFWYSPVLNKELHGKAADIAITPRNEADVIKVAGLCAKLRIPITVRGGATGNYGQAVPLHGGVLLDLTALDKTVWWRPGVARLQAGARLHEIDALTRPGGWELRMHPSTKRMATIGGFVAGGSGGVGSVTYGGLREPGNILAARVVTVEETPRVIELRGDAAQKINRAYGTTGIITELEMPLAPAWRWIDVILAFDDFMQSVEVGREIALADGIVKKLVSPIVWPIPSYFRDIRAHCPDGKAILVCMIAEPSLECFKALVGSRAQVTYEKESSDAAGQEPLYEYTWNHTTLQLLKVDRSVTYLQCLYPHDRMIETVKLMMDMFPDEVLPHLEMIRFGGRVTCSSLPIVRYRDEARLNHIIAEFERNGVMIANPHVYTLEDGSRHKRADADQTGFKGEVDPMGLLNPGKMRTFQPLR
ncbi:MAG: FAD-binding oxidoreductase [Hyphomicrobiales bacterium]|nr:FAD-binding oxidoreductase [Hyphomicrobiales bacterium]